MVICCGKQVPNHPSKAEAAATAAFDQLWSEEQQAADRAAAKKAKKLKQKAKKQQDKSLQVLDSPSQGSGGFQAVSVVSTTHPEAFTTEIELHANEVEPSPSSSECMPVARQLFMSDDIASPSSNNTSYFAQQSSQQGSNHSHTEAAFTQLSLADLQTDSQPPSQELQGNPRSSMQRLEGDPGCLLPELSFQNRASSPGTAEQQSGQTAASPDLDSGHGRDSPALIAGQAAHTEAANAEAADAEAADAEAAFLHTLFCCPITKVPWLCSPTSPVLQRQQGNLSCSKCASGCQVADALLVLVHICDGRAAHLSSFDVQTSTRL